MTAFTQPKGRQPRGAVKIYSADDTQGEVIDGWVEFEIDNNNFYSADTFHCTFAVSALPADRNAIWFSNQQDMFVELFIGFPTNVNNYTPSDLTSWIYGQVDGIELNVRTQTISVHGRDLTRVFIDTKTTQKYANQTSSAIATALATKHSLSIQTVATDTKVGVYYEIDQVHMTDERSEWDLLNYLADQEGYKVWVRGTTLYFMPAPTSPNVYNIVYQPATKTASAQANFEDLTLKRALTVSRGIQVQVKSWNKSLCKTFTANYPAAIAPTIQVGKSLAGSGIQIYKRTYPNLTQEQTIQKAQALYEQLVQHEMQFDNLSMPGDNDLDITSEINLSGTGTAFDQTYYPDCIKRVMSLQSGYGMVVSAKNHSTDS